MPQFLTIDAGALDPAALRRAASAVIAGGLVVFPTDTFYGIAADPRNTAAVARLFDAKARDAGRASPLIAANLVQAERAVEFSDTARRIATRFWPGPLSIVLVARALVRRELLSGETAAIRVPDHPIARALAELSGFPITATSANLSGRPPANRCDDLDGPLLERVDVVIDGGVTPGGVPSTIVDLTSTPPRLVRSGPIAWERVLESLE